MYLVYVPATIAYFFYLFNFYIALSIETVTDPKSDTELKKAIRSVIASKQYGYEELLSDLIAQAALTVMPKNPVNFNVDSIRVVKIMGSNIFDSKVVNGMVFGREAESLVHKALKAKIGIFTCPLDITQTETKGTVLIHNAQEMLNFTKDEERRLEQVSRVDIFGKSILHEDISFCLFKFIFR